MSSSEQIVMLIPPEDVRRSHELLGRGTYGTVYKGRWQGIDVAIKLFDAQREIGTLQKEVGILAHCQHPNIVQLYGVWLGQESGGPGAKMVTGSAADLACPYYVMELADSGTVADVVHNRPAVHYSIGLAFSWFLQCAKAVDYLHAHQPRPIIHRDLKSMNLLLFDSGRVLKVCDFGTVREQSTDMTSSKGTVAWMAPEILTNSRYSTSVDVYSLGMVMWEVLARSRPFKDMNSYSIMFHIHAGQRPPQFRDCPDTLRGLLAACLHQEPNRRPTISGLAELLALLAPQLPGYSEGLTMAASDGVGTTEASGNPVGGDGDETDVEVTEDPPPPTVTTSSAGPPSPISQLPLQQQSPPPLPPPRPRLDTRPLQPTPPPLQPQPQQQLSPLPLTAPLRVTNTPQLMPSLATPESGVAAGPALGGSDQLQLLSVIWDELPAGLRPPPALPGNRDSEALFADHQRLLQDYATEQMTLMRLTQEQKDLEQQLLQLVSPEQLQELLELKLRLDNHRRRQVTSAQRSLSALELNNHS